MKMTFVGLALPRSDSRANTFAKESPNGEIAPTATPPIVNISRRLTRLGIEFNKRLLLGFGPPPASYPLVPTFATATSLRHHAPGTKCRPALSRPVQWQPLHERRPRASVMTHSPSCLSPTQGQNAILCGKTKGVRIMIYLTHFLFVLLDRRGLFNHEITKMRGIEHGERQSHTIE